MRRFLPFLMTFAVAAMCLLVGRLIPTREANAQADAAIVPLVSGWNIGSVSSGSAVLSTDFKPTRTTSVFRIAVVLGSSAPLSIRETDGTHTFTSLLNGGSNLSAGTCFTFVWESRFSATSGLQPNGFNFIVGSPTTVPIIRVTELTGSVD